MNSRQLVWSMTQTGFLECFSVQRLVREVIHTYCMCGNYELSLSQVIFSTKRK